MAAVIMHHFSGLAAPFVRSKGTVSGGVFIFKWGISFGEPYHVEDKGNRPVAYAGKQTLIQAILERYP